MESQEEHLFSIDKAIDQAWNDRKRKFPSPQERKNTKIVFTALHGTSIMSLPAVLEAAVNKFILWKNKVNLMGIFPQ